MKLAFEDNNIKSEIKDTVKDIIENCKGGALHKGILVEELSEEDLDLYEDPEGFIQKHNFKYTISLDTISIMITGSPSDELEKKDHDLVTSVFADIKNGIIKEVSNFLHYEETDDELILTVPTSALYDVTKILINSISIANTVYMDDITSIIPLSDIREKLAGTEVLTDLEELLNSEVEE